MAVIPISFVHKTVLAETDAWSYTPCHKLETSVTVMCIRKNSKLILEEIPYLSRLTPLTTYSHTLILIDLFKFISLLSTNSIAMTLKQLIKHTK